MGALFRILMKKIPVQYPFSFCIWKTESSAQWLMHTKLNFQSRLLDSCLRIHISLFISDTQSWSNANLRNTSYVSIAFFSPIFWLNNDNKESIQLNLKSIKKNYCILKLYPFLTTMRSNQKKKLSSVGKSSDFIQASNCHAAKQYRTVCLIKIQ